MSEMRLYDDTGNRLYLNAEERADFLAAARKRPPRDRTLCETLLYTGCSPSELIAIFPGWVNTEFSNRSVREIATDTGSSIQDVGNDVLSMQAIPGHLEPQDMVGGYLFLASDLARDITGQSLHIDRGECQN